MITLHQNPYGYNFYRDETSVHKPKNDVPLATFTNFVEISPEPRIREIQVYSHNKIILVLHDDQQVEVDPYFTDLPNVCNDNLKEYLNGCHIVATELSDGSYKLTVNLRIVGGGCGHSKISNQVDVKRPQQEDVRGNYGRGMQSLPAHNANIHNTQKSSSTKRNAEAEKAALQSACRAGNLEEVRSRLQRGVNVNNLSDEKLPFYTWLYKGEILML